MLSCVVFVVVFLFKRKTAYEMRISDWSSDVCSSDLGRDQSVGDCLLLTRGGGGDFFRSERTRHFAGGAAGAGADLGAGEFDRTRRQCIAAGALAVLFPAIQFLAALLLRTGGGGDGRSEEHTSELQSLMRTSYAVFCLKKNKIMQQ